MNSRIDNNQYCDILIPKSCNYIAAFLTLQCNYRCSYCINLFSNKGKFSSGYISGRDWVKGLNRINPREDIPVTLQGGEPSLHPDFIWIINNLRKDIKIDILTNLQFNVQEFIAKVNAQRFNRNAPYSSIRVSYHSEKMDLDEIICKVKLMQKAGFSIGVYGILHPKCSREILVAQKKCQQRGIDFRTKDFLGEFKGEIFGNYKYKEAIGKKVRKNCLCRTTELIIGPDGSIYRCHHDLYEDFSPIGHILDSDFQYEYKFRKCSFFGYCNPCDVKIKTNRFQEFGHTSVEIKSIREYL